MLRLLVIPLLVAVSLGVVHVEPAHAQPRIYEEARQALEEGRFAEAAAGFAEALSQASTTPERWRARLGLALSRELDNKLRAALEDYQAFLEAAGEDPRTAAEAPWPDRMEEVQATIYRLEARLRATHGVVTVQVQPEGARVEVRDAAGGSVLDQPSPARRFLVPGRYEVQVSHEGYEPQTQSATLSVGQELRMAVALKEVRVEPPDPEPIVIVPTKPPETSSPLPWVAIGTGAAALVGGAVMTGLAAGDLADLEDLEDQPGTDEVLAEFDRTEDRMNDRQTASWVLYGVGGVAVGTGIVMLLLREGDEGQAEVTVEPRIGGGVATWRGTF